jgi:hypothetical protein
LVVNLTTSFRHRPRRKKIFDFGLANGHDRNTASTVSPLPGKPFSEAKTALQALKTLQNRLRCG